MEDTKTGSGTPPANDGRTDRQESKTVDLEEHKKVVGNYKSDMFKYKDEAKVLREENEELKSQQLKEKEDFKGLYEREKTRADNAVAEATEMKDTYFKNAKLDAIKRAAMKAGIRDERDVDVIDLKDLQVERTTMGRIMIHGAETLIEGLKKDRPHWFKDNSVPPVNSGGTTAPVIDDNKVWTFNEVEELRKKDPAAFAKVFPKYKAQAMQRVKPFISIKE